jgi:hypothetical protein
MKKETYSGLHQAIISLGNITHVVEMDIASLTRLFHEDRKQMILNNLGILKEKIDFLETEINLIDEKNHFIEA